MRQEHFRREGDFLKWREEVEKQLVSLTAAQRSTDAELDDIQVELQDVKLTLTGDPKERDGGLIGQFNSTEAKINTIRTLLFPDGTGHGGLLNEFRDIKVLVLEREKTKEYKWKFLGSMTVTFGSILIAIISTVGLLITNWDKVSIFLNRKHKADPVQEMIENAKHPRRKHRGESKSEYELPIKSSEDEE